MKPCIFSLIFLVLMSVPLQSQQPVKKRKKKPNPQHAFEYRFDDDLKQTPDSIARLEKWFFDAKFGAFIHFGVYSSLEGEYQGRGSQHRYSEWIQVSGKITADDYHDVAAKFNPAEFDADAWAKVFKDSGLRYVVITSKHHDGFALFDSMVSDYNIVDHSPFKRDIIKELSEACHRNGLKFGVYYSQAQDWDEPDAPFIRARFEPVRWKLHPELPADFEPDMDRYIAKKSLPQVEELVKNYELDLIWFDTPSGMDIDRIKQFSAVVRKHRPDCLINSRLIHSGKGKIEAQYLPYYDYVSIGDKEVPTRKLPLYVESPDSVSSSFGYKTKGNCYYHTEKELIHRLVGTVCAGGNYLLNNGPMGNGRLDPEAIRLYGEIGKWLKVNGEAIYETRRSPLPTKPDWGDYCVSKDGKTLFLHVLQWPESGSLEASTLSLGKPSSAVFLESGEAVPFEQINAGLNFTLPAEPLNQYDTVIKVTFGQNQSTSSEASHNEPLKESAFGKSLVAGKFILPPKAGWWNWGMAPIYDEQGRLHIFNSSIPFKGEKGMGFWQTKSIINHYVADSVEGPFELVGAAFSSDKRTYHNPQISKVGDTYVLVFLTKLAQRGSLQSIGMATAKSLEGPWIENANNPIIRPTAGTPNSAHASNPTFVVDREGKYRIYYKSMSKGSKFREISVAISDEIDGPYVDSPENPLISYKDKQRDIEDPYAFFYRDTYYMIVEDRMDVASLLSGNPSTGAKPGGNRPGLLFTSKDGIHWDRPELSYNTVSHYFDREISRSERPHILWKDGKPEYLFLANHDHQEAGFYLKIEGWNEE